MKTRLQLLLIPLVLIPILIANSCKHEPEDIVDPDPDPDPVVDTCDPDTVYFETDLLPLLASTCSRSGCHNAASAADGVIMETYQSIMQTADITAGNPNESDLYEVLIEDDPDKIMPPPPNAALTNDQIQLVYRWISQGAENLTCIQTGCDLENVTFAQTVTKNLQDYGCIGCHSGASPSAGVQLGTYQGTSVIALSGRLMGAIRQEIGYASMPPSGSKMTDCQISQIQKWIDDGTPNN